MFAGDVFEGSVSLYSAQYATPPSRPLISSQNCLLSSLRSYPIPRGECQYSFPPLRNLPVAVKSQLRPFSHGPPRRKPPLPPTPFSSNRPPILPLLPPSSHPWDREGFHVSWPKFPGSFYPTRRNRDFLLGGSPKEERHYFPSGEDADSLLTEENVYSYAGEDIIPPALVIRAEALLKAAKEGEENVYEEIADLWDNPSLVQRVLEGCNPPNSRKVLSALNIEVGGLKGQRRWYNGAHSPDSGLTMSASDSSGDGSRPLRHSLEARSHKTKLKRCESLDIKDLDRRRPRISACRESVSGKEEKGWKNPFQRGLEGVKERMEKTRLRLLKFSKKDKRSSADLSDGGSSGPGGSTPPETPLCETCDDSVPNRKRNSLRDSHSSRSSKSSRSSTVSGPWTEERLYEDIVDLTSSPSGGQSTNDGEDAPFFSRRLQVHRQLSSSDSWGSEDFESCSSNEDDEKTQPPLNTGPENFKQRLLRKREQWLERRQSNRNLKFSLRKDSKETKDTKETANKDNNETDNADTAFPTETKESRLQRWFSLRKSNYDVERKSNSLSANLDKGGGMASYTVTNGTAPLLLAHTHAHAQRRMPRLLEEDQESVLFDNCRVPFEATFHRRQKPPALPPMPQGLTPEQIKRRHIVASIVHSENNYVTTLLRLVSDYKKPLVESKPPILNSNKLNTLFYRVPEILRSHILFRIALNECVKQWDKEEKIGDVFVASFSNAVVLDDYSDFINNFSRAMDVAKQESKKKSAFADFLKVILAFSVL